MPLPPPLAVNYAQRIISDPDDFDDAVSGMKLTVEFQRRQVRPSRVEQFQTPAWGLDFGDAQVKTRVRGVLPAGWASLCLVQDGESTWNGQPAGRGTLCCVPPGEELHGRTAPGFRWMTVGLPPEVWAQSRALAGLEDSGLHRYASFRLPALQFAQIEGEISRTHHLLHSVPALGSPAALALASHLATSACEFSLKTPLLRDSLRNRARLARRAEAWLRAHFSEPIRIVDLCLQLRASRRELEYAFRTVFDLGPHEFLHKLRLNAIRRALLRRTPGDTVLSVLLDHGLTHAGRFSADYHAIFGERPSETLRG